MSIFFEVRSSTLPDGAGEQLEPSRYLTRKDAENAAQRESLLGFFSSVWMRGTETGPGCEDVYPHCYLCEYAAKVAA